jgi:hypothetical protein
VYVRTGVVDQEKLEEAVSAVAKLLDTREVRRIRFTLGPNVHGEPSIFFAILLTPYATNDSRFADVTGRVTTTLFDELQPFNRWGLQSYFNFTANPSHFKDPRWM